LEEKNKDPEELMNPVTKKEQKKKKRKGKGSKLIGDVSFFIKKLQKRRKLKSLTQ
jgi:hypothetical protein